MQRQSLTTLFTFVPSESSFSAREQDARRSRQQQRSAARALLARSRRQEPRARRRSFFSRLAALRVRALLSRSRQAPEPRRASHDVQWEWDWWAGYPFTVQASTEAIRGLRAPVAGEWTELGCTICLEDYEAGDDLRVRGMPCSHSFHEHCIFRWLRVSRTCPCCRLPLPSAE